jgi:transposase
VLKKEIEQRQAIEMVCTDMLVPQDHLLRKIDKAVDFSRIYEFVEGCYCEDNGRPSIDPVVLFKLVMIQHLFGIRSLRQTQAEAEVNVAYRWFLGYTMSQQIPHFSTISYAFRHRFTEEIIERVFRWILEEIANAGYLKPEIVFIDGTHIKANANLKKHVKKEVPRAARVYEEQLMEEINADREAHGKKPFKDDDDPPKPPETKRVIESTTDPESGVFHKGEHKKCFAYEAHTVCDRHNFVLEVEVTPGNVNDSAAFDPVYDKLREHYPEAEVITADAAYKTPWICKRIIDDGRIPSMPYKRPMTKEGNLPWYEYVYDEYYDCVLCPHDKVLSYATTNREGYREYKSKSYICQSCPDRERCTASASCTKTVTCHIWKEYIERAEDIRHTELGKKTYAMRSQTIERVFADAKEKHAMRYTPYRGLKAVTNWVKLKFATMNLKKLALWLCLRLYALRLFSPPTNIPRFSFA